MLHVLTHNILPVFAMLALGFVMGRMKTASIDEARAVNRIAFLVLQPPLIFMLLTGLDLGAIHWGALGLYALCEVIGFTLAFLLARHVLGCDLAEAWLLGMAVVFVNTLLRRPGTRSSCSRATAPGCPGGRSGSGARA